jgi:hypothetical protein
MNQIWRIICISITVVLFSFKFIRFLNPPPEGNAQIIAKFFNQNGRTRATQWKNGSNTHLRKIESPLKDSTLRKILMIAMRL